VPTPGPIPDSIVAVQTNERMVVLAAASLVFLMPASLVLGRIVERVDYRPAALLRGAVLFATAPYAAIVVAAGTFSPFLYFQF
jgi:alginate O-acetyltransferase complex protein AlgI